MSPSKRFLRVGKIARIQFLAKHYFKLTRRHFPKSTSLPKILREVSFLCGGDFRSITCRATKKIKFHRYADMGRAFETSDTAVR